MRRARRNKKRAWYKLYTKRLSPTFLIDWHLSNQPTKITSVPCFSNMQIFHTWEKCRLADLKNSLYLLIFSTKNKAAQWHLTSCEIKGGREGYFYWRRRKKIFEKTTTPGVLVLMFWLDALEFKILKFLFSCCLYIFLGNFPWFSVHKSLKLLEKYIANFFKGYINYLRRNQRVLKCI